MAFGLILGGSGQGKTEYLMEEVIRESLAHPSEKYYVLVPEQFSLEMQRQMLDRHPRHGFSNIDVLSFHRLAYRVFDECGFRPGEILEDLGVSMILKKVLMEHREDLVFFRRSAGFPGFLEELKSMLMEFVNYGLEPSAMEEVCLSLDTHPGLRDKFRELSRIFSWFTESIRDSFMVSGQILSVLKDLVPSSRMLKEGTFYLDGFTGFTPVQMDFLKELLPLARELKVTVAIPYIPGGNRHYPREDLFAFSEKTIYSLWDLCAETGTGIEEPVLIEKDPAPRYHDHEDLAHLEKNMFRKNRQKYGKEVRNLHLIRAKNPDAEADYVLHRIEELVRKKGYRYRDFAILMGNEEDYPSAFQRRSRMLDIPLFVDARKKMTYHSGAETIRSLFHLARMNYSYESVFRYLKSGMSDLSPEDVDFLEDYIFSSGVRGSSMWNRPFERRLTGYSEENIEKLERCRLTFVEETLPFVLAMREKKTGVRQKITILYETLHRLRFRDKLLERAEEAEQASAYEKAQAYRQSYGEILDLMDKIVAIFGEEVMGEEELAALLDAGLENLSLASPPLSMDQVILGDLKRTRLPEIRILFFVGMNDGDMPPVPEDRGILTDEERRILEEKGVTLALNLTQRALEDEFYMYLAFAKPGEELYLTCCESGPDGGARNPSLLFSSLRHIFPGIGMKHFPEEIPGLYFTEKDSREFLIRKMREWAEGDKPDESAFYALLRYWQEDHPGELKEIFARMKAGVPETPLPGELADRLYGTRMEGSVTRMESFARCPFLYFCRYGLDLFERQDFSVQPVDLGTLFHSALEYYSRRIREMGCSFRDVPPDLRENLVEESVGAALGEDIRDVVESSERNRYKKTMVTRILRRTVEVLASHLARSSFEPDRFELKFSPADSLETTKIDLPDGRKIAFSGVIDRVDICEEEDKLYLKVIDYKTGTKKFDFNELYYGLQIQLIVYLNAAMEIYKKEKGKNVEPAAIFYYRIQDPILDEEKAAGEKYMNTFRMTGYANRDPQVLRRLEEGGGSMESFSLTINKDGTPRKGSPLMETGDFLRLGDYVRKSVAKMGERIYAGEIRAYPCQDGKDTACKYCPYASVCGFEQGNPGHVTRKLENHSDEEILAMIGREVD